MNSPKKDMPFALRLSIEDVNTSVMYEYDCVNVKLRFTRNTDIGCDGSKALVTMDPNNSLEASIIKYLVGSRGTFMLLIDAWSEDHS